MKDNLTEIVALYSDNIPVEGFFGTVKVINGELEKLKNSGKDLRFTVASFGKYDGYKKMCENLPAEKLEPEKILALNAESFKIALLDSATALIDDTGARYAKTPEEEIPSRIVFVIFVFGKDNASKKHTYEDLKWVIAHQSGIYKWEFFIVTDTPSIAEKLEIPDENVVIASTDTDDFLPEAVEKLIRLIVK